MQPVPAKRNWMFPLWAIPIAGLLMAIVVLASWYLVRQRKIDAGIVFSTPYQAVTMSNGQMFYGRLEGYGATAHPVLREVHYIKVVPDPKTKEPANVLVKRSKDWHAPDRMVLNASQILLVEPVDPASRVAEFITALKLQ